MTDRLDNSPINACLIAIRSMNADRFDMPKDGRKGKILAEHRFSMLEFIASFSNGDGTFIRGNINYSPSVERIMARFRKSDTWVYALELDLHELRFLNWKRQDHHRGRREYSIDMNAIVPSEPPDEEKDSDSNTNYSPGSDTNYSNPDTNHSPENGGLTPTIGGLTPTVGVGASVSPSKERTVNTTPPTAGSPSHPKPKPKGTGKAQAIQIVDALRLMVRDETDKRAKSYGSGDRAMVEAVKRCILRGDPEAEILSHARKHVRDIVRDGEAFDIKNVWSNLASELYNLKPATQTDAVKDQARADEDKRSEAEAKRQLDALRANAEKEVAKIKAEKDAVARLNTEPFAL